jgi:hypothetical protein
LICPLLELQVNSLGAVDTGCAKDA